MVKDFIESYTKGKSGKFDELVVDLKKDINNLLLRRVSKPGQRIYIKSKDIKRVKSGLGINILSTSKGLMTGREARRQKLGGEVICQIY